MVNRFSDNRQWISGDLALLTGGLFMDGLDVKFERVTTDLLGSTGTIITKEDTIVLNGEGSTDSIQACC